MNRWAKLGALLVVAAALLFLASCEGPEGPAGTATCMNCHTDDFEMDVFLQPIQTEFAVSRHNTGDTYLRRGSTSSPECSRCHTTEGYQYYVDHDSAIALAQSSRISCFACHAPHTFGDFRLRQEGPPLLPPRQAANGIYDKGPSNTCVNCHQAREPVPIFASADTITSSRWGPHHSGQASVLAGIGAYEFDGVPYEAGHQHNVGVGTTAAKGCVQCHMAKVPVNLLAGGHTFAINYETTSGGRTVTRVNSSGCAITGCHPTTWTDAVATTYANDYQEEFQVKLEELGEIMFTRGWLDSTRELLTSDKKKAPYDKDDRGAVYNYLLLGHELSFGVHNPTYAEAVLEATKAYLTGSSIANR